MRGIAITLPPMSTVDSAGDENVTQGHKTATVTGGVTESSITRVQ